MSPISAKALSARREGPTILAQRAQPNWGTNGTQAGALVGPQKWYRSWDYHGIIMGLSCDSNRMMNFHDISSSFEAQRTCSGHASQVVSASRGMLEGCFVICCGSAAFNPGFNKPLGCFIGEYHLCIIVLLFGGYPHN